MKELIYKHLDTNYKFEIDASGKYILSDKINNKEVGIKDVLNKINKVFSLEKKDLIEYFSDWLDTHQITA